MAAYQSHDRRRRKTHCDVNVVMPDVKKVSVERASCGGVPAATGVASPYAENRITGLQGEPGLI